MKRMIAALFAVSLSLPAAAVAHDASKHKGKPVHGKVASVTNDGIELKTTTGTVPVTFSSKTKFEHGNAVVDKTHVTKGTQIAVFGTKLPTGEMVAREVLIGAGEQQQEATATAKKATATPSKGKAAPAHGEHKH
jgi:hypothetical protein